MKSDGIRLDLLIASLLPVAVMLAVGVVALRLLASVDVDTRFFLLILMACALGIFFCELFLLRFMEYTRRTLIDELVAVCRDYLAGKKERRATASGDDALDTLVSAINTLLDWATVQIEEAGSGRLQTIRSARTASTGSGQFNITRSVELAAVSPGLMASSEQLERQIQRLICEVASVMDGDLRVHATVPQGRISILADVCNTLLTRLIELVAWTCYSSDQLKGATQILTSRSLKLTQTVEIHLKNFSETTVIIEKLVAFMQRLSDTLQQNEQNMQEIQISTQQARQGSAPLPEEEPGSTRRRTRTRATRQPATLLTRLNEGIEQQSHLFSDLSQATIEHAAEAESMITDLSEFAQKLHGLCLDLLHSLEGVSELATLAARWRETVIHFQLPESALAQVSLEIGQSSGGIF